MKRLDDRFSDRDLPASTQLRFQQATQKKEESLEDWADRVLSYMAKRLRNCQRSTVISKQWLGSVRD